MLIKHACVINKLISDIIILWIIYAKCFSIALLQVRAPIPPQYLFVIDVSAAAIRSGMVATACKSIK